MKSADRTRLVVAITGGIGCGKSTAARDFEKLGWERIDADQLIHLEIFPQPDVLALAVRLFGPEAVQEGQLNRPHVGRRAFADPAALVQWEQAIHPRLYAAWERRFQERTATPLIVEVPLLFEKALEKGFDFVVCVVTSSDLQLARLEERGLEKALAEQRISRQWPLSRKMDLSHFVLSNDGNPSFLQAQVAHLSRELVVRR